jgi:hypothetical protein
MPCTVGMYADYKEYRYLQKKFIPIYCQYTRRKRYRICTQNIWDTDICTYICISKYPFIHVSIHLHLYAYVCSVGSYVPYKEVSVLVFGYTCTCKEKLLSSYCCVIFSESHFLIRQIRRIILYIAIKHHSSSIKFRTFSTSRSRYSCSVLVNRFTINIIVLCI